jgi:hypothetical protein
MKYLVLVVVGAVLLASFGGWLFLWPHDEIHIHDPGQEYSEGFISGEWDGREAAGMGCQWGEWWHQDRCQHKSSLKDNRTKLGGEWKSASEARDRGYTDGYRVGFWSEFHGCPEYWYPEDITDPEGPGECDRRSGTAWWPWSES